MTRIYNKEDIPKFDIDYRKMIEYAHSVGKKVPDLTDQEKEQFIHGATMDKVREKQLKAKMAPNEAN